MKKIRFISNGDFADMPEPMFIVEAHCCRCGNQTRVIIDKDEEFDRTEAEYWEERYKDLMGQVNGLLRYVEAESGWNPQKEKFIKMLIEIREKIVEKGE